jgi:hypothetical protein
VEHGTGRVVLGCESALENCQRGESENKRGSELRWLALCLLFSFWVSKRTGRLPERYDDMIGRTWGFFLLSAKGTESVDLHRMNRKRLCFVLRSGWLSRERMVALRAAIANAPTSLPVLLIWETML